MSHNIPKKYLFHLYHPPLLIWSWARTDNWAARQLGLRILNVLVKLLLPRYYRIQPLIGLAPTRHRDWDIYAAVSTQENIYTSHDDIYRRRICVGMLSADTQPGLRGCEDTRLCIHA